jgi:hypothetical protein
LANTLIAYGQPKQGSVAEADKETYAKVMSLKAAELGINIGVDTILSESVKEGAQEFFDNLEQQFEEALEVQKYITDLDNEYSKINRVITQNEQRTNDRVLAT